MQRFRILLAILLTPLLSGGCAAPANSRPGAGTSPAGVPALTSGAQIPNACLVDAIACYTALQDSGAEPAILGIYYRTGGEVDGHAMTRYFWPPRAEKKPWTKTYLFDRTNRSTDIPASIDPDSAASLASWIMPAEVTRAWWLDPAELTPRPVAR